MYGKFHYDPKGMKHLKLGAKKVSGEEKGEDTSSRSILGDFQRIIKSDQKSIQKCGQRHCNLYTVSICIQILGIIKACKDDFFEA